MNRQKLLLIILLGCLALSVGYGLWTAPQQEKVSAQQAFPYPRKAGAKGATAKGVDLRVDLLSFEPGEFPGFKKDIFTLGGSRKRVSSVEEPSMPVVTQPVVEQASVIQALAPPSDAELMRRELAKFTFMGYLDKAGERTVFLGIGDEIFFVKKGSRFGGMSEFSVQDLNKELLVVLRQGDVMPITIPLVEKSPLLLKEQ